MHVKAGNLLGRWHSISGHVEPYGRGCSSDSDGVHSKDGASFVWVTASIGKEPHILYYSKCAKLNSSLAR